MNKNTRTVNLGDDNMKALGLVLLAGGVLLTGLFLYVMACDGLLTRTVGGVLIGLSVFAAGLYTYGCLWVHELTIDLDAKTIIDADLFTSKRYNFQNISKVALEKQNTLMTDEWKGCLRVNVYDYSNEPVISVCPIPFADYALHIVKNLTDGTEIRFEDKVGLTEPSQHHIRD